MPRSVSRASIATHIPTIACISSSLFLLALALPRPAFAHDTWLLMKDYVVKPSVQPALLPISSHVFTVPGKDFIPQDKVTSATLTGPDGVERQATPAGSDGYQSSTPLETKGSYLAVVKQQAGFYSKTPDGGVTKNKKDAPGAVDCRYSEKHAKALFTVGAPGGDVHAKTLGLPMELVPLQNPATLKVGALLDVKVLFDGKPAASTVVFGTYAGFSDMSGTFAYTTSTDKEGIAKIKLIKSGTWLLLAKREQSYKDPTVCDKQTFAGSLTFQVK
jgi:uncharacterized GH25 family protein